jgi:calcium/calmodulin-dependent protein kinase I
VTQLATGGELFDRICEQGRFTEKDASQTIKQILDAVDYLHDNNVVHRDLKPENLIYVTKDLESDLVLADFGIAKTLGGQEDTLQTMAGSFGYAAPEVMDRKGHGKPVDMWSMGVITYTLLCGYSPFRSENLPDLLEECNSASVVFHERYWKDVSQDAKDFINCLIVPDPDKRWTSKQALKHSWLTGKTATDHDLLPELRKAREARAKLRHAILAVSLKSRIAQLKDEETDSENDMEEAEGAVPTTAEPAGQPKTTLKEKLKGGAVFREVVLATVRDAKHKQELKEAEEAAEREKSGQA